MSSSATVERTDAPISYLNATTGWKSWLFTTDHKRIALLYLISITFFFGLGGIFATLMRLELATPQGHLQQALQYARHYHGVLLPDPFHPRGAGKFPGAHDGRRPRPGFSQAQPAELVHLHDGGLLTLYSRCLGRRGYGLDVLHAAEYHLRQHQCAFRSVRSVHRRVLLHSHRPEFRGYDSQDARARHDLVPHAAVSLGDVCHQPHL
jgi:hypothetical protein